MRTSKKEPIELAWDEFVASMDGRKHGLTDAFKFAWKASKPWVGLTDEEIAQGNKESWVTQQAFESAVWWAEAKLKEKNT